MNLLEKAKKLTARKNYNRYVNATDDELDLLFGWLNHEISNLAASRAMGFENAGGSRWYSRAAIILKKAFTNGQIKLERLK